MESVASGRENEWHISGWGAEQVFYYTKLMMKQSGNSLFSQTRSMSYVDWISTIEYSSSHNHYQEEWLEGPTILLIIMCGLLKV